MANKARPHKVSAPYRKYVAGQGYSRVVFGSVQTNKDSDNSSLSRNTTSDENHDIIAVPNDDDEMLLPWELQAHIIWFMPTIPASFLCVCKTWKSLCLPIVYASPRLSSRNFSRFVEAIVADRRQRRGDLVVNLDLSTIMQSGKNSYVSKLLRRCSARLEQFVAPQTSFGYAPLISLKSCHQLKFLDLGLVSETVKLRELFAAIRGFQNLTHLSFPRSSIDCSGHNELVWPQNLIYLKLSGGITNDFLMSTTWPNTITTLEFSYCPQVDEHAMYSVLSKIGDRLKHLAFHYPMPSFRDNSLDYVFRYCQNLLSVRMQVDYCSKWAFSEYMLPLLQSDAQHISKLRPLEIINLDGSGSLGLGTKIHPDDFTIALLECRLPSLRGISVSVRLGWDFNGDDVEDLVNALEEQEGSLYVNYN